MKKGLNLETLEAWCLDALGQLSSTSKWPHITKMEHDLIIRYSGNSALYELADDFAIRLGDLPLSQREEVRHMLINKHGIDFNIFLDKKLKKIRSVLKRGKIRNETEFRDLSEFASDTSQAEELLEPIELLLGSYTKKGSNNTGHP